MDEVSLAHVMGIDLQFCCFIESKTSSSTIFDNHCFIHDDHAAVDCCFCDFVDLLSFVLTMATLMPLVKVDANSHDVLYTKSFFH